MKLKNLTIRKAKNGFILEPAFDPSTGSIVRMDEILVFESMDTLLKFIADNFSF